MLNQIVLVGRIVKDPELRKGESKKEYTFITLAIPRSYKNSEGKYDTDFVDCVLWDSVAKSTVEYCKKGDIVGVKGRIQSRVEEQEDKTRKYFIDIIAERVTFLSSNKKEETE